MRILGLDIGDKRIGVAMSDPLGILASALTLIERKKPSWATAHQRITKIACHSEGAKRPKNLLMQGSRDSSPLAQNDTPIELYFRNKRRQRCP